MLNFQKKLSNTFYAILALPATAMGFALCVQISALSWILSTKYNLNIEEIGLVWASGPLAGLVMQLLVGLISDKVWFWGGRRRPFILIGGVIASLMLLCLPNLDAIQKLFGEESLIPVALCVAMTLDLAINLGFNPTRSIITDVTPDGKERTKGYVWMQTVSGTFGVLAYFIGARLGNYNLIYSGAFLVLLFSIIPPFFIEEPKNIQSNNTIKSDSYSFKKFISILEPFYGYILIVIYNLIKLFVDVPVKTDNYISYALIAYSIFCLAKPFFVKEKSLTDELKIIPFKRLLVAHSFTWLGVQAMFVFMYAYAMQILYQTADASVLTQDEKDQIGVIPNYSFLILNAVGALLPSLVLEPLTKRFGRINVHSVSLLIMSIGYLCIVVFGDKAFSIYFCMAIAGIGWAAIVSLPFAIMSERVDKRHMGLFMGIFNMSIVIPQLMVSFFISKIVNEAENKVIIFEISAICLFLSFILWRFVKETKTTSIVKTNLTGGTH